MIYLHFLAIKNNATMNSHVQVFVWTCVFISLGYIPRNGGAGSLQLLGLLSSCGEWRLHLVAVCGLLVTAGSLVAEHRL